jgi:hypothetical protein
MIDDKYLQLIHQEIDGEIGSKERSNLHNYLSQNAEARAVYEELMNANELMNYLHPVEPPRELTHRIMESIDHSRYAVKDTIGFKFSEIVTWISAPNRKPAYAFAMGLIIGLVLSATLIVVFFEEQSVNLTDVYGTISNVDTKTIETITSSQLNTPQLKGEINLKRLEELIWFEISLQSEYKYDLTLSFNKENLTFIAYRPSHAAAVSFINQNDTLKLTASEHIDFDLFFNKDRDAQALCNLELNVFGKQVYSKQFRIKK